MVATSHAKRKVNPPPGDEPIPSIKKRRLNCKTKVVEAPRPAVAEDGGGVGSGPAGAEDSASPNVISLLPFSSFGNNGGFDWCHRRTCLLYIYIIFLFLQREKIFFVPGNCRTDRLSLVPHACTGDLRAQSLSDGWEEQSWRWPVYWDVFYDSGTCMVSPLWGPPSAPRRYVAPPSLIQFLSTITRG